MVELESCFDGGAGEKRCKCKEKKRFLISERIITSPIL